MGERERERVREKESQRNKERVREEERHWGTHGYRWMDRRREEIIGK